MTKLLLDQSIFTKPTFYLLAILATCFILYALYIVLHFLLKTTVPFYRFMLSTLAFLLVLLTFTAFNVVKEERDSINAENRSLYRLKRYDKALVLRSIVSEFSREQVVTLKIVSENDKVFEAMLEDRRYIIEKQYLSQ